MTRTDPSTRPAARFPERPAAGSTPPGKRGGREPDFRALVESTPDLLCRYDRHLRFTYVSPSMLRTLGCPQERLLGQTLACLPFPRQTTERWEAALRRALTAGQDATYELQVDLDGRLRHFSIHVVPETGPSGRTRALVVFARDLSDLKRAESERARLARDAAGLLSREREARLAAEEQARRFAALLGSLSEGVAVFDASGRVILRNDAAAAITGVSHEEALAPEHFWRDISLRSIDGRLLTADEMPYARALRGEPVSDVECLLERPDGATVRIACSGGAIRDEAGRTTLAIIAFRDVTELRRLQQAKDEFLEVLAHELRNPLAAATGLVDLVGRKMCEPGRIRFSEYLGLAKSELWRLRVLIDDIIDGYRVSEGRLALELRPIDLADVLEEAVRPYRITDASHELKMTELSPGGIPVVGDANRLVGVMTHLLSNAVKYSPEGSEILVETALGAGEVTVRVADRGIGIPPDQLEKVFEGFFRASNLVNRQPGGIGLGLYVSRDVIRRHAGELWAENRPGGGTVLCLRLPLRERCSGGA